MATNERDIQVRSRAPHGIPRDRWLQIVNEAADENETTICYLATSALMRIPAIRKRVTEALKEKGK